jgi:hypothetical protein
MINNSSIPYLNPCSNNSNLISASGSIPCINPLGSPILSSFGGKIPNPTTQIKQFYAPDNSSSFTNTWNYSLNPILPNELITLTPTIQSTSLNVYIPGDLTVMGTIHNPSDEKLKEDISDIYEYELDALLDIKPKSFTFKNDSNNINHYGIIAQDLEKILPCLVTEDKENKFINYIELIPLLIGKIQLIQKELDELKNKLEL